MSNSSTRRDFLGAASGVAAGAALAVERGGFPTVHIRREAKNVAVASANRLRSVEVAVKKDGAFGASTIWARRQYPAFDGETAAVHDTPYLYERE